MDHAVAVMGMMNEGFVRANCEAFGKVIDKFDPDVLIDFWNPFAVISARSQWRQIASVIQAGRASSGGVSHLKRSQHRSIW
jgi:hypothetical protein